jgi:hypothetical protein
LSSKGTDLRILTWIRLKMMMIMTTTVCTALVVYSFHFITNFRNCDIYMVRWRFLMTRETVLSCHSSVDEASVYVKNSLMFRFSSHLVLLGLIAVISDEYKF